MRLHVILFLHSTPFFCDSTRDDLVSSRSEVHSSTSDAHVLLSSISFADV